MQAAAVLWQVYDMTSDPLALGVVGLINVVPVLTMSFLSGILADSLDRRRLMLATQGTLALLVGLLSWLTWRGIETAWPIYAISFLSSTALTFEAPARQALIPNLVPREHLPNAYSLFAIVFQMGSIFGPAVAGIAVGRFGVAATYGINTATFLIVVLALLPMRAMKGRTRDKPAEIGFGAALEGLRFVRLHPLLLSIMLLDFFATFFSSATALLPVFARDILQVGPQGYGWLNAAASVGAAITATFMSLKGNLQRQGRTLLVAIAVYSLATVLFGVSRSLSLSFFALAMTGAGDTLSTIIRQTVRNLQTPDNLRGRIASLNMIFFRSGPELGELEAGLIARLFGAPVAVVSGGLASLIVLGVIAWRTPALRDYRGDEPILVTKFDT